MRRMLRASCCVGARCIAQFALAIPPWYMTPLLAFDDPRAAVHRLHPSPDGRHVTVEHFHRPSFCTTWWIVDAVADAPPRRVSTSALARATGLGTCWRVALFAWSVDGNLLVGQSARGSDLIRSQSWALDPATLAVEYLENAPP